MPTVGPNGNIHVVGQTTSRDFPVTSNAIQSRYGGGESDAVLAVLSPDGKRLNYATYIGGDGEDLIRGLAIDKADNVWLAGNSNSSRLNVISQIAAQPKRKGHHDGFILKLAPTSQDR